MNQSAKQALVILPTLNEAKNLPLLVPKVVAHDGFRLLIVPATSLTSSRGSARARSR